MSSAALAEEPVPWEEKYRRLVEEAPFISGDEGEKVEGCEIEWANPDLINEGQRFVRENMIGLSLAHSGALILGFSLKNLSTVLLRTGGFNGVTNSIDRIMDTEEHIMKWYGSDIFYQTGPGHKGIQVVRKMHNLALRKCLGLSYEPDESSIENTEEKLRFLKALRDDLECVDTSECPKHLLTYNPKVLMNQMDMALTQYGFFAPLFMYPHVFGANDPKGLEGFTHLWAVIGRLLGIRDRYNLALNPSLPMLLKIHDQIGMASLKEADLTVAELQFTYAEALSVMIPTCSLPSLVYFGLGSKAALPQFEGNNLYSLLSWQEKMFVYRLRFVFFLMYHFHFIRRYMTKGFDSFAQSNRAKALAARKERRAKEGIKTKTSSQRA